MSEPLHDRRILYTAAFLRALATGMIGVLIGLYLAKRGLGSSAIGVVVAAGLAGAALAALFVTLFGDRVGRLEAQVTLSMLGALGGVGVALVTGPAAMAAAAFLGMLNGMGRDRGASLILDQATLPETVSETGRTSAFAWYNVFQDAGHALGGLLAATPLVLRSVFGFDELLAYRIALLGYAGIQIAIAFAYA